ncbi:uncharacterized protein LOC108096364 [Drosophila ficusphila]|uniref:uncharacterized protein LOC108096364 n=1 Tax=Drosophila ficusphila TaxID=30025 RepID=UPI0007E71E48|nr:uncharacterized protein LOC108096364 [Drosophila ficusphila]
MLTKIVSYLWSCRKSNYKLGLPLRRGRCQMLRIGDSLNPNLVMTSRWLLFSLLLYLGGQEASSGVMDNFNDGLKMAGQMFGINTAADVANLVAKAFAGKSMASVPNLVSYVQKSFGGPPTNDEDEEQNEDQSEEQSETENAQEEPPVESSTRSPPPISFDSGQLFTNMLRMVGFDTRKIGALALNALIMIAQAIGSSLMQVTRGGGGTPIDAQESVFEPSDHRPRSLSIGSPIDFFLQRTDRHSKRLIKDIMDRDLPDYIVNMIEDKENPKEGINAGCLKLLMCKGKPLIWGMQESLKKRLAEEPEEPEESDSYFNKQIFFKYLPSLADFRNHSASCETKYHEDCPKNATTGSFF